MCEDGLMERGGIQQVFALHNEPGLPIGRFSTATGSLAAAADGFRIQVEGKGTHGADPHLGVDTLLATANILMALQSIVARNLHPMKAGVVTVGSFHGGIAGNIIPQRAEMVGTVRSFDRPFATCFRSGSSPWRKASLPPTARRPPSNIDACSRPSSTTSARASWPSKWPTSSRDPATCRPTCLLLHPTMGRCRLLSRSRRKNLWMPRENDALPRTNFASGYPYEETYGYSRAVRAGGLVFMSGTSRLRKLTIVER